MAVIFEKKLESNLVNEKNLTISYLHQLPQYNSENENPVLESTANEIIKLYTSALFCATNRIKKTDYAKQILQKRTSYNSKNFDKTNHKI